MTSKRGLALSKSSSSPPTMIESVPFLAPTSPPETGASSIPTPLSLAVRASSRARGGEEVLISTMSEPSLAPSNKPPSPATTSSTSDGPGSMVMLMSLNSATSHLPRRIGDQRPVFRKLLCLDPGAVMDHKIVACLQEVARHGRAHDPEPREAYPLRHLVPDRPRARSTPPCLRAGRPRARNHPPRAPGAGCAALPLPGGRTVPRPRRCRIRGALSHSSP